MTVIVPVPAPPATVPGVPPPAEFEGPVVVPVAAFPSVVWGTVGVLFAGGTVVFVPVLVLDVVVEEPVDVLSVGLVTGGTCAVFVGGITIGGVVVVEPVVEPVVPDVTVEGVVEETFEFELEFDTVDEPVVAGVVVAAGVLIA
jgi:hypothetical protein